MTASTRICQTEEAKEMIMPNNVEDKIGKLGAAQEG